MIKKIIYSIIIVVIHAVSFAQVTETAPPSYIKTINFAGNTNQTQLPIIKLGETLNLGFDVLNGDEDDYYYKISYYNYDWTPSVLVKSMYMNGLDNQRIRNYENSYNTHQIYSHYALSIPNARTKRLKVSGNYLLSIFNDDDMLVFSRKFMIYENQANVGVTVKRTRNIAFIEQKQRVNIIVSPKNTPFNNPKETVKPLIIQNNNLNTTISNLKPLYTIGNKLIYKYDNETSFWAGNEYLFFENKDVRAANTGIQSIDLKELYHNYLYTNRQRANSSYTYNPDINGNYLITNIDADNPNIEADYVWIHFSLLSNDEIKGKNIHVYGNFNNYNINENTKMTYDAISNTFTNAILLKQGFYNYKYIIVNDDNTIDEGAISGNFYQTENEYKVLIYYRDLGARYDRIVGLGAASSVNISN